MQDGRQAWKARRRFCACDKRATVGDGAQMTHAGGCHCGRVRFYDVDIRCLDTGTLESFTVLPFDGQRWEESAGALSSLSHEAEASLQPRVSGTKG